MSETTIERFRKTGLRFLLPAVLAAMVVGLLACGSGAQPAPETPAGAAATAGSAPASGGQSAPTPAQPTAAPASETQLQTQGESFEVPTGVHQPQRGRLRTGQQLLYPGNSQAYQRPG